MVWSYLSGCAACKICGCQSIQTTLVSFTQREVMSQILELYFCFFFSCREKKLSRRGAWNLCRDRRCLSLSVRCWLSPEPLSIVSALTGGPAHRRRGPIRAQSGGALLCDGAAFPCCRNLALQLNRRLLWQNWGRSTVISSLVIHWHSMIIRSGTNVVIPG